MAKTSRDARRHIREWSEFFKAGQKFTEILVDDFIRKHQRNKYLKQSLKRLINQGFVVKNNTGFKPTLKGLKFFKQYKKLPQKIKTWNGKWYIISFDIPVDLNSKRNRLRNILKNYDFYRLQKSVWVGPTQLAQSIWEFIIDEGLEKFCKIMIVDVIDGDEEIKKHFDFH